MKLGIVIILIGFAWCVRSYLLRPKPLPVEHHAEVMVYPKPLPDEYRTEVTVYNKLATNHRRKRRQYQCDLVLCTQRAIRFLRPDADGSRTILDSKWWGCLTNCWLQTITLKEAK